MIFVIIMDCGMDGPPNSLCHIFDEVEGDSIMPHGMDLDSTCFTMPTNHLRNLIELIARLTNYKVRVKDKFKFNNCQHVISDPIVVKIYVNDIAQKELTKSSIIS